MEFFWSPDSHSIEYQSGTQLRRMDLASGLASTIVDVGPKIAQPWAAWGSDNSIVFSGGNHGTVRVPADGGDAKDLMAPWDLDHLHMGFDPLPDGRRFLFYIAAYNRKPTGIWAGSTEGKKPVELMPTDSIAVYAAPGYVLYLSGDTLVARPFRSDRLSFTGPPLPLVERVARQTGPCDCQPLASVSQTGVLVYRAGTRFHPSQPTWFDRAGTSSGAVSEPANYSTPALSPDGGRLAVTIRDPQSALRSIWIIDLVRGGRARLTAESSDSSSPVWSPDGTRIAYASPSQAGSDLFVKSVSGASPEERLLASIASKVPDSWSADGARLSFSSNTTFTGVHNVQTLNLLKQNGADSPFHTAGPNDTGSKFSPDSKFIAYSSRDAVAVEIFVQRLEPPYARWKISTHGGEAPQWRGDGRIVLPGTRQFDGRRYPVPWRRCDSRHPAATVSGSRVTH